MNEASPIPYIQRQLSAEEAEQLRAAIGHTPNITGYTTQELLAFHQVIVATVGEHLVGVCISIDLPKRWTEIALLYVFEEYRGQGIGKDLFEKAWHKAVERKRDLYVVSRNPTVIRYMSKHAMQFVPFHQVPLPIHAYNIHFILSPYRIKETTRKSLLSRKFPPFRYGIKVFGSYGS